MALRATTSAAKKKPAKQERAPVPPEEEKEEEIELPDWVIDARGAGLMTDEDVAFWIKSSGWTPVEFLTTVYRGPFQKMEHRISAAKAVLEYAHRKLPTKLEIDGAINGELKLDSAALSKLTDKELDVLLKLLEKAGK